MPWQVMVHFLISGADFDGFVNVQYFRYCACFDLVTPLVGYFAISKSTFCGTAASNRPSPYVLKVPPAFFTNFCFRLCCRRKAPGSVRQPLVPGRGCVPGPLLPRCGRPLPGIRGNAFPSLKTQAQPADIFPKSILRSFWMLFSVIDSAWKQAKGFFGLLHCAGAKKEKKFREGVLG